MNARLALFRTRPGRWDDCLPPSPADRMERYSQRHAADMRARENAGAAAPRVRIVDGREVLVALPGRVNRIGTYRSKRGPVPGCPQPDEFDERTPTTSTTPAHVTGKEQRVPNEAERYAMEQHEPDVTITDYAARRGE